MPSFRDDQPSLTHSTASSSSSSSSSSQFYVVCTICSYRGRCGGRPTTTYAGNIGGFCESHILHRHRSQCDVAVVSYPILRITRGTSSITEWSRIPWLLLPGRIQRCDGVFGICHHALQRHCRGRTFDALWKFGPSGSYWLYSQLYDYWTNRTGTRYCRSAHSITGVASFPSYVYSVQFIHQSGILFVTVCLVLFTIVVSIVSFFYRHSYWRIFYSTTHI